MKLFRYAAVASLCAVALQVNATGVESVTAESLSGSSARVSWSATEGAAYYDVYQDGVQIANGVTGTTLEVTGLAASTDFQFFVTACMSSGVCSVPSSQASINTSIPAATLGICEATTDGSSPTVELNPNGDGTARLAWCEVTGADGYNIFIDGMYDGTFGSETFDTTVSYTGSEQYQVAYYANGEYPPKSAVAMESGAPTRDKGPTTDIEGLELLDRSSQDADVEIYFTRHAEKMTQTAQQEDGSFVDVCGEDKCAEVLNAKGELRAELLKNLFKDAGITDRLTHAFSSHKIRTRQTIEMITADAGLTGDMDKNANDGIQEFPVLNPEGTANATELDPESTSPSEAPVIEALLSLPSGSVALVAGHSGTLYDIMAGLGLTDVCLTDTVDSCNEDRYPIDAKVKVKNFGDIWKVVLQDGEAQFVFRANFQPAALELEELAN